MDRIDFRTAENMHKWTATLRDMMAKSWRENCADTGTAWPLMAYVIMTECPAGSPDGFKVDPKGEVLSIPLLTAPTTDDAFGVVRNAALASKAVGVCLMMECYRNTDPEIIPKGQYAGKPGTTECLLLYVEHKRFAPQLWFAEIKEGRVGFNGQVGGRDLGPWEQADEGSVKGERLLPEGWMS